jgi:hypothetical protein
MMVREPLRIIALVGLILAALLLKSYLGAPKDLFRDFGSEVIGLVVAIFLIDRIIKYREDRSWRPTIKVIHRKVLTEILDPFLYSGSRLVQDIDRFTSDIQTTVELRSRVRKVVIDARNEIQDLFDTSGPRLGSELSNGLQTLDAQLGEVLAEERAAKSRIEERHPGHEMQMQPLRVRDGQVKVAMEPLSAHIRESVITAQQIKSWLGKQDNGLAT